MRRMKAWHQMVCGLLAGWLAAGGAWAQAPGGGAVAPRAGQASIYSADRRFVVSGLSAAENMVMAKGLADLAAQIERHTGMALPMSRDQVLGVMIQSSSGPDAQILRMQGWDGGRFYQRVVAPERHRLDGEDLLEAVAWLLLNRYAAQHTPPPQQAGMGAVVPEWISAGIVQNTQAALRSRNRDWVAREMADGRHMSLAKIIRMETMPPGRWREKAYAAAAVEFLFPEEDARAWGELFQAAGTRQAIDAAWVRANCAAVAGGHPETAWREFLGERARTRTIEAWSDRSLQLENALLACLTFRPRAMVSGVPFEVPDELFARDLIEYRGQEWVAPLAAALSLQVQGLRVGAPARLQEVLAGYAAYFDQFGKAPVEKTGWLRRRRASAELRPLDDATWQVALNQLWLRAERVHQQFLEELQARKRYVDGFDRPGGEVPVAVEVEGGGPRTQWQRYVDEVEGRGGGGR